MNHERLDKTARLAMALGMLMLSTDILAEAQAKLDARTARELSVISRVLEKRLSETRADILSVKRGPDPTLPAA